MKFFSKEILKYFLSLVFLLFFFLLLQTVFPAIKLYDFYTNILSNFILFSVCESSAYGCPITIRSIIVFWSQALIINIIISYVGALMINFSVTRFKYFKERDKK